MQIAQGIEKLAKQGLNIFASLPVRALPEDLKRFLPYDLPNFENLNLCVLAHGGKTLWQHLPHPLAPASHPIDDFTRSQVDWFAREVLRDHDYIELYPLGKAVLPLQRFGRFLNLARPSLLGLDMNSEFGVWFAYRSVFLTSAEIPEIRGKDFNSACDSCVEKPCQSACPATAVGTRSSEFKISACADYRLQTESRCADRCLARMACPIQSQHRYLEDQIQYHMQRPSHLRKLSEYKTKSGK